MYPVHAVEKSINKVWPLTSGTIIYRKKFYTHLLRSLLWGFEDLIIITGATVTVSCCSVFAWSTFEGWTYFTADPLILTISCALWLCSLQMKLQVPGSEWELVRPQPRWSQSCVCAASCTGQRHTNLTSLVAWPAVAVNKDRREAEYGSKSLSQALCGTVYQKPARQLTKFQQQYRGLIRTHCQNRSLALLVFFFFSEHATIMARQQAKVIKKTKNPQKHRIDFLCTPLSSYIWSLSQL